MEEKLREELYEKLSLEYDSFIEEVKKLPPEKIIDKSGSFCEGIWPYSFFCSLTPKKEKQ